MQKRLGISLTRGSTLTDHLRLASPRYHRILFLALGSSRSRSSTCDAALGHKALLGRERSQRDATTVVCLTRNGRNALIVAWTRPLSCSILQLAWQVMLLYNCVTGDQRTVVKSRCRHLKFGNYSGTCLAMWKDRTVPSSLYPDLVRDYR
jgi:hypothetical protein